MDRDEETAPAVTTAAATAKAPAAHGALGNTAQMLAWVVASPFVAAALLKYSVAAAVADAARLGVFLLPMYLCIPFLGAVAVLVRWRCKRHTRGHAAFLRHLLPLGALGGLVHVLTMVAVVALPLLPAMLIANCDGLWLVCHRLTRLTARGTSEVDEAAPTVLRAELPGRTIPVVSGLLFAACIGLSTLDAATSVSEAHSLIIGVPAAALASVGRPLHVELCRRAVAKRCGREVLSRKLPLPLSSHKFVGFERGHLDLLDRLHGHRAYASVLLGLDGPSTFELASIAEHLFALPFASAVPMFLLWSPIGKVGGALTTSGTTLSQIPTLALGSNLVDLIITAVIGVIVLLAPWLTGVRAARMGPLHFGAARLGLLFGAGLLGSAAGGVVLTTSIGGALLCFGTASCLYAVFENERFAMLGAERVVSDLVAYRDATAADVERFCGDRGVLALDGVAQRRAGVKVDTFCRVVAEQLQLHAHASKEGADMVHVQPTGGDDDGAPDSEREEQRPATLVGQGDDVPEPQPGGGSAAAEGATVTPREVDNAIIGEGGEGKAPNARKRKGSWSVRTALGAQVAADLVGIASSTYADPGEVAALFPPAKPARHGDENENK